MPSGDPIRPLHSLAKCDTAVIQMKMHPSSSIRKRQMELALLIGSHARGDADSSSDWDLLFINMNECDFDYSKLPIRDRSLVNSINYDIDTFSRLYEIGSLFLHHAFTEGCVLDGNAAEWNRLKETFIVQNNFHNELVEINRATELLSKTKVFGGRYFTPLVNSFTELKNACIFYLAHQGIYEFNKSKCFDLAIDFSNRHIQFKELKAFYDFSIRGLDVELPFDWSDETISISLLKDINKAVKEMCDASR